MTIRIDTDKKKGFESIIKSHQQILKINLYKNTEKNFLQLKLWISIIITCHSKTQKTSTVDTTNTQYRPVWSVSTIWHRDRP